MAHTLFVDTMSCRMSRKGTVRSWTPLPGVSFSSGFVACRHVVKKKQSLVKSCHQGRHACALLACTCLRADHCVLPAALPGGMEPVSVTAARTASSAQADSIKPGVQQSHTCSLHPGLPCLCERLSACPWHGHKSHSLYLLCQVLLVRHDADHQLHSTAVSATSRA